MNDENYLQLIANHRAAIMVDFSALPAEEAQAARKHAETLAGNREAEMKRRTEAGEDINP